MKKILFFSFALAFFLTSCSKPAPAYNVLGEEEKGGATIIYIEVDTDDLSTVDIKSLASIVKELISNTDAQAMFERNSAYYFYDKSQNVTLENANTDQAKVHYWYLTKTLIRRGSSDRAEVSW